MRYIKTKDGKIIDVEKILENAKEKYNSYSGGYYQKISSFKLKKVEDELVAVPLDENGKTIKHKNLRYNIFFRCYLEDIVKQSDNLDELIDEYILKDTETGYCGIMDKEVMKHSINPGTAYGREFYGAIWAIGDNDEPILKSVSKFNSEERLALLCEK